MYPRTKSVVAFPVSHSRNGYSPGDVQSTISLSTCCFQCFKKNIRHFADGCDKGTKYREPP